MGGVTGVLPTLLWIVVPAVTTSENGNDWRTSEYLNIVSKEFENVSDKFKKLITINMVTR
jgi:hypothetical protein